MCIRDRYQRRVHGIPEKPLNKKSSRHGFPLKLELLSLKKNDSIISGEFPTNEDLSINNALLSLMRTDRFKSGRVDDEENLENFLCFLQAENESKRNRLKQDSTNQIKQTTEVSTEPKASFGTVDSRSRRKNSLDRLELRTKHSDEVLHTVGGYEEFEKSEIAWRLYPGSCKSSVKNIVFDFESKRASYQSSHGELSKNIEHLKNKTILLVDDFRDHLGKFSRIGSEGRQLCKLFEEKTLKLIKEASIIWKFRAIRRELEDLLRRLSSITGDRAILTVIVYTQRIMITIEELGLNLEKLSRL
eukprot:TRINITY_DN7905_c0_g4_i2.p1 TRINITY_DN7905_c0_g4~~TRINITY_DN7905_c0_g4_i2.p1  ORF type:complete len:302 (+),score=44.36 TRINITY_DN7905_c0_g4_i2:67-972(+)